LPFVIFFLYFEPTKTNMKRNETKINTTRTIYFILFYFMLDVHTALRGVYVLNETETELIVAPRYKC